MSTLSKNKIIVFFLFITFCAMSVFAQSPPTISVQGTLKDANGTAISDGAKQVTFKLYATSSGGSAVWTEVATVEVAGGIYSHYLGSVTPLQASVFANTLFLGVTIGAYELTPRSELTYAPYTFTSNTSQKVVCSGAVGDVKYSILNPTQFAAENGSCWIPMDGRAISGKLKTSYGFNNVPNAGGLFLRSQEYGSSNYDPDRSSSSTIAQVQTDDIASHAHNINTSVNLSLSGATTSSAGSHSHTATVNDPGHSHTFTLGDSGNSCSVADDTGGSVCNGSTHGSYTGITVSNSSAGAHTHTVSGNATGTLNVNTANAGSSETRPNNMNLYIYIRVD